MKITEKLSIEIEHLSEKIDLINDTMTFQFTLFWAILGVVIAGLGLALIIMIRRWVEHRVDSEVQDLKKEIKLHEKYWVIMVMQYGWRADEFELPSFTKDFQSIVHLRGVIRGSVKTPATILPVGYRPSQIMTIGIVTGEFPNCHQGTLTVKPNGEVMVNSFSNDIVYLNGISFDTEELQ